MGPLGCAGSPWPPLPTRGEGRSLPLPKVRENCLPPASGRGGEHDAVREAQTCDGCSVSDERMSTSYRVWLRAAARNLRRRSTPTEQRLWPALRNRRFGGWRFRRQRPIGPYIVNFLCAETRLVVEIDGTIHDEQRECDAERDEYMEHLGYRVIRFPVDLVNRDLPEVLTLIQTACASPPLPRAGEGAGG